MKLNKINPIKILLIGLMIVGTTGCNEDWLEPKPLSFFSPENTYNEASGLWAALVACEKNMRHEYTGDGSPILTEHIFTEVAVEGTTDKSGPAQDMNLLITPDAQLNSTDANRIGWYWYEGYKGIKYANTVVSRIDEPQDYESEAERNHLLATAYFHRSLRYYRLTQQFGDIPLILEEVITPKLDFYSTDRTVILRKMKEDLDWGEEWIPVQMDRGQVQKGALQHLLIKINLALGEFQDALAVANRLIDNGPYSLMTKRFGVDAGDPSKNIIWDLHRPENKAAVTNTETILLVMDRIDTDGNSSGIISMRNAVPFWGSNINTPEGNKGTSDKAGEAIDQVAEYGRGIGRLRGTWYSTNMIWDDEKDLRHAPGNWMNMTDLVYNNPGIKSKDSFYGENLQFRNADGVVLTVDTIRHWFSWPHYKLYVPDPQRTQPQGGPTDWYIFRLAESYLLRAEVKYWLDDLSGAAEDINAVRTRAGADPYTNIAEINIGTILDERARELYYEEPRKTELTRMARIFAMTGKTAYNGKSYNEDQFSKENFYFDRIMEKTDFYNKGVFTRHGDTYTLSAYHVLWPIPQGAINSNTKGHLNQNEGYIGFETNIPPLTTIEVEE